MLPGQVLTEPGDAGSFWRASAPLQSPRRIAISVAPGAPYIVLARKDDPYWCVPQFGIAGEGFVGDGQFLLWQSSDQVHHLVIPLVDADCRTTLRSDGEGMFLDVEVPLEGEARQPLLCYHAFSEDPYAMLQAAGRDIARALGTVRRREEKAVPGWVDYFGWCTWDAFYQEVDAASVVESLEHWRSGGVGLGFMILDDGWLDSEGDYLLSMAAHPVKFPSGLGELIERARGEFGLRVLGIWHTLQGYWGGMHPDGSLAEQLKILHGRNRIRPWLGAEDPEIDLYLMVPEQAEAFYQEFYKRLKRAGVSMVKVDNQSALERFTEGIMDRVPAMRAYQAAMQAAAETHMVDGSLHCMSHGSDVVLNMDRANVIRNSSDYLPGGNEGNQKGHIARNAHNSLYFSLFALPDWDMLQTNHAHSGFHAAARALSGGPVYVSDKSGQHDFALVGKLIYHDSGVARPLRFGQPALPSPSCLYRDPQRGELSLKMFNHAAGIGLLGLFHCLEGVRPISDTIGVEDIPVLDPRCDHAVWLHHARVLRVMAAGERLPVELASLSCELVVFSPVENGLAPLGLLNKFNAPVSIEHYEVEADGILMRVRDGGEAGVYCARVPETVFLNGSTAAFNHDPLSGLLTITAPEGQPNEIRVRAGLPDSTD